MSCFSMGFVEQDLIDLDLRSKEKAIQVNSKRYTMLSSGHTRPYNDIDDYNQPYKSMKDQTNKKRLNALSFYNFVNFDSIIFSWR